MLAKLLVLLITLSSSLAEWKLLPHHEQHLKQLDKERVARELAHYRQIQKRHEARDLVQQKLKRDTTTINEADKEALQALYKSTDGNNWNNNTGWKKEQSDPCTDGWFGVYCQDGYVTYLSLVYNGLYGNLPEEISQLSKLNSLYLYSNELTGQIPSGIWGMKSMQYLDMNSNKLTGGLPSEINMPELLDLALYANQLTGQLPTTWNTPKLTNLELAENTFMGELPTGIGQLMF